MARECLYRFWGHAGSIHVETAKCRSPCQLKRRDGVPLLTRVGRFESLMDAVAAGRSYSAAQIPTASSLLIGEERQIIIEPLRNWRLLARKPTWRRRQVRLLIVPLEAHWNRSGRKTASTSRDSRQERTR